MKKIVTTIALIMAFSLTAFASHDTKRAAAAGEGASAACAVTDTAPAPGTGHSD